MKITAVSFSYSENSMSYRGLLLMDHYIKFSNIIKMDLPICDSNKPDGEIPKEVEELDNILDKSDILVFSVPEYTGHYSVGFKNLLDWLVVKGYYNASLGQKYSISNSDNEIKEAERIDQVLQPVHKSLFIESNPCPVKYAAKLLNLCEDDVRLPLVKVTEQTKEIVKKSLQSAKLI